MKWPDEYLIRSDNQFDGGLIKTDIWLINGSDLDYLQKIPAEEKDI